MGASTVNDVKLATKIGDHSESVAVVGKTKEQTKQNLLKLFSDKDDKKTSNYSDCG